MFLFVPGGECSFVGKASSFCVLFTIDTVLVMVILVNCYFHYIISPYCPFIIRRGGRKRVVYLEFSSLLVVKTSTHRTIESQNHRMAWKTQAEWCS